MLGRVISIDDSDSIIKEIPSLEFSGPRSLRLVRYFLAEERYGKSNIVCGLFRLDFLRQIQHWSLYRHNKYGGGDYLFALDCIQHGEIIEVPEVRLFKRVAFYSKEFLSKEPGPFTKAFRHIRYLLDCVDVVKRPADKLLLLVLIPVRLLRAAVFQTGQYSQRITGRLKRALHR